MSLEHDSDDPLSRVPNAPPALARPEDEVDVREYLAALRRRWPAMLLVAGAVFALGALNTLRQRKIYSSSTKLVVTTKSSGMKTGAAAAGVMGELADLRQAKDVDTQAEIIGSADLIEKAFNRLSEEDKQKGYRSSSAPGWAYSVSGKPETDIVNITSQAYSPDVAAKFANSIAETYLQEDLSRNSQATRQAREYVQREKERTRNELQRASARLAAYKRKSGLVAVDQQASGLAKIKVDLRNSFDTAKGESIAAQQRLGLLKRQINDTAPDIASSTTVAENPQFALVRNALIVLENKLIEQSQEYTPTSPEIVQTKSQIEELTSRAKLVSRTIVSARTTAPNPLLQSLLTDFADARAGEVVASARVQALGTQLSRLESDLKGYPEQERQLAELQQGVDVLSRTYNMLSDRYYTLLIDERSSLPSGMIAAKARPSRMPSSPKTTLNLAFAIVLALVCGVGVGLVLERLDTKAHTPQDVEKVYGLTSLALVPEATPSAGPDDRLLIGQVTPNHAFTEGFRLLRNNIGFLSPDNPIRSLAVTSAAMGEGKSTTSVNLAIAMAMDGKRVLLVDADLRRPTVHKWMQLPNEVGFSSVVRGLTPLVEAIQTTAHEGLFCLTSGPLPPDPTEFLNSDRSHELIRQAKGLYDAVIVDAPPSGGLSDTQVISTMVDGMLVVAALDKTPKPQMAGAIRMLRQAHANLLGLVINRVKDNGSSYGYYGYYGYSTYGEDTPSSGGKSKKSGRDKVKL